MDGNVFIQVTEKGVTERENIQIKWLGEEKSKTRVCSSASRLVVGVLFSVRQVMKI